MKDIQTRLIDLYLRAMSYDSGLCSSSARLHLEWLLGNEYRHTSPCRDCGETTRKDRAHEAEAA